MDYLYQGVVTLIRSTITGEKYQLPDAFDMDAALELIRQHGIPTLVYEGAVRCGQEQNTPAMQRLFQSYVKTTMRSERQMRDFRRVISAFNEQGIEYMLLKGCKLKDLYPKPEMRIMGDADILIRLEQYDKIVPIMKSLGFTQGNETDHELIWTTKSLTVELHKRLIPSYNEDFYEYFGDGWKLAQIRRENRFSMTPEAEFVYLFTHFAKHFRDRGIGCRHVVDLWVFLRENPTMDGAKVQDELKKLQLLEFYKNIRCMISVWFEDRDGDEMSDLIGDYIFRSGSNGERENAVLAHMIKKSKHVHPGLNARWMYIISSLFPTVKSMEREYPILINRRWLVPVVWLYRLLEKMLFRRKAWKGRLNAIKYVNDNKLSARQSFLNSVGLDYHF